MFNSNVISTPLEVGHKCFRDDCLHSPNEQEQIPLVPYAQIVGNLMHSSVYIQDQIPYTLPTPYYNKLQLRDIHGKMQLF
jgi:hypothetical protein